jgi:glutamine amidotransferase
MFFLALTFGLERDASGALERMAGLIEAVARRHGIEHPLNMTVCVMDGEQIVAARYSSEGESRSLFHSNSFAHLHELYPENARINEAGNTAVLVLSEPLVDLPDVWAEIPESCTVMVRDGVVDHQRFVPRLPAL